MRPTAEVRLCVRHIRGLCQNEKIYLHGVFCILQPQCLIILFFATGVFSKISKHAKAENKRDHALICKPIANKKLSYR